MQQFILVVRGELLLLLVLHPAELTFGLC